MKKRQGYLINAEKGDETTDENNETVKRTTYIPLSIFAGIVAVWGIIKICQVYIPAPDDTKVAIDALLGFLTLVVIVVQSAIIKMQWKSMQDAINRTDQIIKQNERSMIYSQSAYLMETDVRFGDYELGSRVAVAVEFTNQGLTPAYDVRLYAHLTYEEIPFRFTHEQAKDISDMPYKVHTHVTGPTGVNSQLFAHRDDLTREMCELERTRPLHFWGLITYTDIFGRERWTEFCYKKLFAGQGGKGKDIDFSMTDLHNDADRPEEH